MCQRRAICNDRYAAVTQAMTLIQEASICRVLFSFLFMQNKTKSIVPVARHVIAYGRLSLMLL